MSGMLALQLQLIPGLATIKKACSVLLLVLQYRTFFHCFVDRFKVENSFIPPVVGVVLPLSQLKAKL